MLQKTCGIYSFSSPWLCRVSRGLPFFCGADIGMLNTKTAVFLTSAQDPKRRLAYRLRGDEMSEKFQICYRE